MVLDGKDWDIFPCAGGRVLTSEQRVQEREAGLPECRQDWGVVLSTQRQDPPEAGPSFPKADDKRKSVNANRFAG